MGTRKPTAPSRAAHLVLNQLVCEPTSLIVLGLSATAQRNRALWQRGGNRTRGLEAEMKPGSYRRRNVKWIGNAVHHHSGGSPVLAIVPDGTWPGMWRVALPDGSLTDIVNLSRVRDAAIDWAVSWLNRSRNVPARPAVRPPIEFPTLRAILWLWAPESLSTGFLRAA